MSFQIQTLGSCLIALTVCLWGCTSQPGHVALEARGEPHPVEQSLPGTYQAEYPVFFAKTGKIKTVRKFLKIAATTEPELFDYKQCWQIVGGSGDWHYEVGGLVIISKTHHRIEFIVAELENAPSEGSTGFFTGSMTSPAKLDVSYAGLDKGIVFRMRPQRLPDGNAFSCPPKILD